MATGTQSDLTDFYQFLGQQVADRNCRLSPEEAVALWRHRQAEIEAIREGLADVEAGRTIPMDEHIRRMRERFQIPDEA